MRSVMFAFANVRLVTDKRFSFSDVDERANLSNSSSLPILTRIEEFDQKQSRTDNDALSLNFDNA